MAADLAAVMALRIVMDPDLAAAVMAVIMVDTAVIMVDTVVIMVIAVTVTGEAAGVGAGVVVCM